MRSDIVFCGQERVNEVRYRVVSSVGRKGLIRSDESGKG